MKRILSAVVALALVGGLGAVLVSNTIAGDGRKPACDCNDPNCKCFISDTSVVKTEPH